MKKVKGFTLIELIVVIAIIGVLAAILIPAMMGWVMKSRVTTYNNNASEICTQLQIVMTDLDKDGSANLTEDCILVYDGSTYSLLNASGSPLTLATEVEDALKAADRNLTDMSHAKWAARLKESQVRSVVFTNNDYRNVGGFPIQCTKEYDTTGKDEFDFLDCAVNGWN